MNTFIMVLMVITLLVVFVGVILMMKGGKANEKYSNKLMTLRVALQALVIILIAGAAMLAGQ